MDGTFLHHDDSYDGERFARTRRGLRERDVRLVIASGNQYEQLRSFFHDPDEFGFVGDNGAYVVDAGEPVFAARGDAQANDSVIDILDAAGINYLASTPGMAYVPQSADDTFVTLMSRYYHALRRVNSAKQVSDRIFKFALANERGLPDELAHTISSATRGAVVPVTSGHGSMDLNLPGIHKASGLQVLLSRWGLEWDAVAAFGDSGNDLEMLACAAHPVAMRNATERVRHACDVITDSNDDDGVLNQIDRWFHFDDL